MIYQLSASVGALPTAAEMLGESELAGPKHSERFTREKLTTRNAKMEDDAERMRCDVNFLKTGARNDHN
jgi:hypothetical protein